MAQRLLCLGRGRRRDGKSGAGATNYERSCNMCSGDDRNCPQFELHRQTLLEDLDAERRSFLKSAFAATGGAAALTAGGSFVAPAVAQTVAARQGKPSHHYLPATAETVHWGYFSKSLRPQIEVNSGDYVTIETLTHHANDDAERMVK